ncbi:hypothetical protein RBE51_19185 [Pseudomonas taiwanensis]|uniref:hypothetical protein n=1 Tax=Pseudomonas taiwanensis TaxID=470150 RepID=UPI0028DE9AB5|nr:hypothetical protein [Pseudomonas taiwanensis]MDT8924915.1 hypothetical protein [Pseudomonas taiwanensis]
MEITISPELAAECRTLAMQIERRYGTPMFRKMYGESAAYAKDCALGFLRSNIDAQCVKNIRSWLLQGLKPFAEYPPNLEMLIQIGRVLKICPVTDGQVQYAEFWYKLDAHFCQGYGRFWRLDSTIESLQRERVWLAEFENVQASIGELEQALRKIQASTVFRSFPPSLEQFKGALLSHRKGGAPLVEDAWLLALSVRPGQPLHPLIVKARARISVFDLNTNGKGRENEQRFKDAYLSLLGSVEDDEHLDLSGVVQEEEVIEYASTEDLLSTLRQLGN